MQPRCGVLMVALSFGLGSGLVFAKGYSAAQPVAQPDAVTLSNASFAHQVEALGYAATLEECLSWAFTGTPEGQLELERALAGDFRASCPALCPSVELNQQRCTSRAFMNSVCGQLEMAAFHAFRPDGGLVAAPPGCVGIIKGMVDTGGLPDAGVVVREVKAPDVLVALPDGGAHVVVSDGGRATVQVPRYSRDDHFFTGMASTYWGVQMGRFTQLAKDNPPLAWLTPYNQERAGFDANTTNVNSCREYVFEKYYDYSLFEERAARLGSDYRAVFDLAYAPLGAGAPTRWAIGTLGRMGEPLRQRNGVVLGQDVAFPTAPQPKNIIFSHKPFTSHQGLNNTVVTREALLADFAANPAAWVGGRPVAGDGLLIMDNALHATVLDGHLNHTYVESWDYHYNKSVELQGFLDEELQELDKVREEFAALFYRRAQIRHAVGEFWKRVVQEDANQLFEMSPMAMFDLDAIINPDPISQFLDAQRAVRQRWFAEATGIQDAFSEFAIVGVVNEAPAHSAVAGARLGGPVGARTAGARLGTQRLQTQPDAQQLSFVAQAKLENLKAAPAGLNYTMAGLSGVVTEATFATWPVLVQLQYLQARAEGAIEAAMHRARALGCLNLDAPNGCDWSPKDFYVRITQPVSLQREPDFQRCDESTAQNGFGHVHVNSGFSVGGNVVTVTHKGVGEMCTAQDYGVSPDKVEIYAACREVWAAETIKALQKALAGNGSQYGAGFFGKTAGDSVQLGSSDFGVNMGYAMGWRVGNLGSAVMANYCDLQPSLTGAFQATGKVFVLESQLITGTAAVEVKAGGRATAHLEVLGQTILDGGGDIIPTTFNVVDEQESLHKEFVRAGTTFFVVIVPISVSAGLAGTVGMGASMGGGTPEDAPGGCQAGNLALFGAFRPFAAVEAFATGSVDAVAVEAGIKVSLTLIRAELPLTSTLAFGVPYATDPDVKFAMESNLDLVLTLLSGRVAAFVELCYVFDCDSWEVNLFSWNGPQFTKNLFHTQQSDLSITPIIDWLVGKYGEP